MVLEHMSFRQGMKRYIKGVKSRKFGVKDESASRQ
jgi:hypothetical protein